MDKITIKNVSSAQVVISVPDIPFRRVLTPGRTISISQDEYDELVFDPGFSTLMRAHYIKVSGLDEDHKAEVVGEVYDKETIAKMLDTLDVTAFAKFMPTAKAAEKETAVQLAIEKGITHSAITALIQKYCDVDLIKAINTKHLAEEK